MDENKSLVTEICDIHPPGFCRDCAHWDEENKILHRRSDADSTKDYFAECLKFSSYVKAIYLRQDDYCSVWKPRLGQGE